MNRNWDNSIIGIPNAEEVSVEQKLELEDGKDCNIQKLK